MPDNEVAPIENASLRLTFRGEWLRRSPSLFAFESHSKLDPEVALQLDRGLNTRRRGDASYGLALSWRGRERSVVFDERSLRWQAMDAEVNQPGGDPATTRATLAKLVAGVEGVLDEHGIAYTSALSHLEDGPS